ncbi:MAG: zf-HC2 domain-containing protein [Solirubrobacteraceae bacterium]
MAKAKRVCPRLERAAAYVLGDLDARTALAYERHLGVCADCREEVDLLLSAAAAVSIPASNPGAADPVASAGALNRPPSLAAAVHAQAIAAGIKSATVKLPAGPCPPVRPVVKVSSEAGPQSNPNAGLRPNPARQRSDPAQLRGQAYAQRLEAAALRQGFNAADASALRHGALAPTRRNRLRLLRRPMPAPAIIGFLAVGVVAAVTIVLSLGAANIRFERAQAGWSPGGAAIKLEGNQLELLVERMPAPPKGTVYQVWVQSRNTGTLQPTAVDLRPDRAGSGGVIVPGNYHDWLAVAVYVEEAGHTDTTAGGAVVVADLRHVP